MQVAILEADRSHALMLMEWLSQAGHRHVCCSNPPEFIACLDRDVYDLLIVDCQCDDEQCFKLIEQGVSHQQGRIPLLLLAAHDSHQQIVGALACGADDFMIKPLHREELLSRVEVLVTRFPRQPGAVPLLGEYGPFCIDHREHLITRYGEPVALTGKDFGLAAYLFAHQGELLSRHRLLADVWGVNQSVNTRTVDMHISRVRKALKLSGTGFEIKTVHQHGYRFETIANRKRS